MFKIIVVFLFFLMAGCMTPIDEPPMQPLLPPPLPAMAPAAGADADQDEDSPAITLRPGGTLRLSMRSPVTLNPLLNEDATVARILQLMFEPLINIDDDLRPVPNLASLDFAFNGASVIVTIREDARWSDGTPVSAEDLIFSIETLQDEENESIYSRNVENFAQLELLGENRVRIIFGTIDGGSAYLFNFPIIPRHHFIAEPMSMEPIGNGPFAFAYFSDYLVLTRNPYSFRSRANIQEVHVLITSDAETDRHAFDRGLIDIYLAGVPEWSRHHSVKPVHHAEHLAMYYDFIGFNFARELPSNLRFRRAIAHAIDVEGLIADVFLTHAMAARSPIHPASWLHEPLTPRVAYNFESARDLARGVNMPLDEEGEIIPLTVIVNRENVEGVRIAGVLVSQMNALGLYTDLLPMSFEDYEWHILNGYFDMFVGGYKLSLQPNLRFAFHSESPENILSFSDPELDRLIEAAAVSGTDSQFFRNLSEIQIYIAEHVPVISLAFRHSAIIADKRVAGDLRPSAGNVFANVHGWYIVER